MARWTALVGLAMMAGGCGSVCGCGGRVTVDGQCETGGEGGAGGDGGEGGAGGSGGATTSTTAACPDGCDDGNACTTDVCEAGTCAHHGATAPDACTTAAKQNSGVCAWTSCVLTDCAQDDDTDGEKCFYEGGVGVCAEGVCRPPCASTQECDDGNPCTLDYCTPGGACSNPEDTLHPSCGDGGTCWKGECCEGCFNLAAGACVATCPAGQTCGALGACQ